MRVQLRWFAGAIGFTLVFMALLFGGIALLQPAMVKASPAISVRSSPVAP